MKFSVRNKETNFNGIVIDKSVWSGKSIIYINGQLAKNIGRNTFTYNDSEGNHMDMTLKGNELTGLKLIINDRVVTIIRKLNILEMVLSLIPLALVVIGGAIGGACGGAGVVIIASTCRKFKNIFIKILFSLGVYVIIAATWFLLRELIIFLLV